MNQAKFIIWSASIGGREILVPAERVLPSSDEDNLQTDLTASEAERLPAAKESGD